MTPAVYFKTFVEPDCDDCLDEPGCVRRAFSAAVSTAHLADHYYKYCRKHEPSRVSAFPKRSDFLESVANETRGAFTDIRNISNAYKHLYIDSNPDNPVMTDVASTGAVTAIEFAWPDVSVAGLSEESAPALHETKVVYQLRDGSVHDFLPTLEAVRDYWATKLAEDD